MDAVSKFANMLRGRVGLQPGDTDAFRKQHSRPPRLPEEQSLALGLFFARDATWSYLSVCLLFWQIGAT